jgi:hypothetical protein
MWGLQGSESSGTICSLEICSHENVTPAAKELAELLDRLLRLLWYSGGGGICRGMTAA